MNAALNTGWHVRTGWRVIWLPANTGFANRFSNPFAVQSICSVVELVWTVPLSSTMRFASIRCTRPLRMMFLILLSCSSSVCVTVAQRYMVGHTFSSRRSKWPLASITREEISNRSRIGDRSKIVAYKTANRLSKHLACLDVSTIHKPRIARHDPSDVIRIDIVLQQKQARVHTSFAGTNHSI